jgi:hypothetical protein
MSIDKIKAELEQEVLKGRWQKAPSRSAIDNVVKAWEKMEGVRSRELPFEWPLLHRARVPWESSEWIMKCAAAFDGLKLKAVEELKSLGASPEEIASHLGWHGQFTNRLATWCWRVHQARPEYSPDFVCTIAEVYARAEQAKDLLPETPPMNVRWLDHYLKWRPDESSEAAYRYSQAIKFGMVEPMPDMVSMITGDKPLWDLPASLPTSATALAFQWMAISQLHANWQVQLRPDVSKAAKENPRRKTGACGG